MSNEDSRDTKTPDRHDESTANSLAALSIRERLEHIDVLTRTLLEDVHDPEDTILESTTAETRTEVRERVLEIRAQASLLAIRAVGPEAAIPYRPADARDGGSPPSVRSSFVRTYSGPEPEALAREQERSKRTDATNTNDATDANDETTANGETDPNEDADTTTAEDAPEESHPTRTEDDADDGDDGDDDA